MSESIFDPTQEVRDMFTEHPECHRLIVGAVISRTTERTGMDRGAVGDMFEAAWKRGDLTTVVIDGMQLFERPVDASLIEPVVAHQWYVMGWGHGVTGAQWRCACDGPIDRRTYDSEDDAAHAAAVHVAGAIAAACRGERADREAQ